MGRFERYAPLIGVVAVVLWVAGVVLLDHGMPADKAAGAEISSWFDAKSSSILAGMTLFGLGSAAFVWFAGTVAAHLRPGAGARLPSIMLASGVAAIALVTMGPGSYAAGALGSENLGRTLEPGAAETLFVLGQGFFVAAEFVAVAFMAAAGIAILRSRLLPAWFGWLTVAVAVLLAIPPIGWAGLYLALPLWTLTVAIWSFVRVSAPTAHPGTPQDRPAATATGTA